MQLEHRRSRVRSRLSSVLLALALLALALPSAAVAAPSNAAADYGVNGGWFYSETGGGQGNGYSVVNSGTDSSGHPIKFWSEFQRLGGVITLGYPVGEPYVGSDGFTYQPFQRGVLQWHPELGAALLSNTFEILQNAGKDDWLLSAKGIPRPIADDGSGGNYQKAVTTRLGWLTNAAIRAKFLANPNRATIANWSQDAAIQLYGLPMSAPEQHGPFISQTFQRIAFQEWTDNVAGMPGPGTVVGVLGGDLIKEAGLLPAAAVQPLAPGGAPPAQPVGPLPPAPAPAPAPAATWPWYVYSVANFPNCGTTYMYGQAQDANGNVVGGMTIKSWNDYGNVNLVSTNSSGNWDRVIHSGPTAGTWYAELVDGSGNQASDVATITFTSNCDPNQGAAVQQVQIIFRPH
jgi:hypothetical protein